MCACVRDFLSKTTRLLEGNQATSGRSISGQMCVFGGSRNIADLVEGFPLSSRLKAEKKER